MYLASHRGHGGTERSPGGDERAQREGKRARRVCLTAMERTQRGKGREEEDTEDELTFGGGHRGRLRRKGTRRGGRLT